ncbi:MAG: SprT family zinc-dependent metalloprotease [Patescibacteria group bacterium]
MIEGMKITFRTSTRARRLRITIKSSGECVVTIPKRMPMVLVRRFVAEKREWIEKKQSDMRRRAVGAQHLAPFRTYADAKQESLAFTQDRVAVLNKIYGFSYKTITVKNQKTRWGSCSRRGNLNFNYRIVDLPAHLADYIVVHELCHLKEFNHGQKFWALVAKVFPNHHEMRKELRIYQTRV